MMRTGSSEPGARSRTATRLRERRPDSQQLVRQWSILRILSEASSPYSVKQLADQLGSSKATIERDLATLMRDFAIIEQAAGKQKKLYSIDSSVRALESITFGVTELLAIYAGLSALTSLTGTPIHDDLREVTTKIRGFLAPRHNGGLDAISRVFAPHARGFVDYGSQHEMIDQLLDAIARRRRCELTYHSTWKDTTRRHVARPLKLVWHRSALYLLACLGEHERITTLAIHRIKDLRVMNGGFAPPRVDLEAHTTKAFGIFASDAEVDVEVLFAKDIAWQIEERVFHPSEIKVRLPDGRLSYRVRTSAQWEVLPWVQSFGPHAELIAPAIWRRVLREHTAAMAALYGRDG